MKSTSDNNSEYIPSGSDVYRTLVKNIQTELFDQFENGNSIFRAHLKKPFANETEIRLAIRQGFRALWESASESAIRLGLAGDLTAIARENVKVQKELERL
jgi:CRISPR/Cas system-associated exonuclease Cas4 (RecB family)